MIFYASDTECWVDENDPTFKVGMTPEGELPDDFETQGDFWNWYYDVANASKVEYADGHCWDLRVIYNVNGMDTEEHVMAFKDGRDVNSAIEQRADILRVRYAKVYFKNLIYR